MLRRGLVVCHTLELIALAIWIGGLVVIVAVVIPAVFNSFGMEPGGRFVTRVFDGYNRVTVAAITVLIICSAARAWKDFDGSWRSSVTRVESLLLVMMIVLAVAIIAGMGPHTVALQEQAFAAKDEADKKQAYDAFFRAHMLVRVLYLANLGLGVALVATKVRRWVGRS